MANFDYCDITYNRAKDITENIAAMLENNTDAIDFSYMNLIGKMVIITRYLINEDENFYLGVVKGHVRDLGALYSENTQWRGKTIRMIVINEPKIHTSKGNYILSLYERSKIFHEVIHHMDYMSGIVFEEESHITSFDMSIQSLVLSVNTYSEQRAYFYAHIYEMRSRIMYRIYKCLGALKYFIRSQAKKLVIYPYMTDSNLSNYRHRIEQVIALDVA